MAHSWVKKYEPGDPSEILGQPGLQDLEKFINNFKGQKKKALLLYGTPGDQTDMEWYLAHNLPLKMVITKDGKMNEKAKDLAGLPLKEARKKIIEH